MGVPRYARFDWGSIDFLEQPAENNGREGFAQNTARYEEPVRGVADRLAPQFQRKVESAFAAAAPFMQFLCKAVGVPY